MGGAIFFRHTTLDSGKQNGTARAIGQLRTSQDSPETRRKCPKIGPNVPKGERDESNIFASRSDIPIATAYFPPSRIDRRKKKRPALLVEERGEEREGDFTCPFPVFMPVWTI